MKELQYKSTETFKYKNVIYGSTIQLDSPSFIGISHEKFIKLEQFYSLVAL